MMRSGSTRPPKRINLVAHVRRTVAYTRRSEATYPVHVRDGQETGGSWAEYIREITTRPDWSVARLARDSGISRSQIFRWKAGEVTDVKVESVKAVARAVGDREEIALRAAGDALDGQPLSPEEDLAIVIAEIRAETGLSKKEQDDLIEIARETAARQMEQRQALDERHARELRTLARSLLRFARRGPNPEPTS